MSSPVTRTTRVVKATLASLANATLGTFDLPHPYDTGLDPRGSVQTLGLGAGHTPTEGGSNSLPPSQANDPNTTNRLHHGGEISAKLDTILAAANVFLRGIKLIDKDGNVLHTLYSDTVGLVCNAEPVPTLIKNIAVKSYEGLRLEIYNNTGGALTSPTVTGKFELGWNAQVAEISGGQPFTI